jgi:DNA polymerase-3 subunit delta'
MSVPEILPWQQANYSHLLELRRQDHLPHAILLHGLPGTGIRQFAECIAYVLMCSEGGDKPCGHCHSCQLNLAGTHPDLRVLLPEKEAGPIKVDQVRDVVDFGQASAQQGGYRVVIVCPAEAMNINAANSLLKTLEEPGPKTLLLLVSYAAATVLPTVRSRCQKLAMALPTPAQSRDWLQRHLDDPTALELLHEFAPRQPLYGLRLQATVVQMQAVAQTLPDLIDGSADVLETAKIWGSVEVGQLLLWLYQWLSGACLESAGETGENAAIALRIRQSWLRRAPLDLLLNKVDELIVLRRLLAHGANPNPQLVLENLALSLSMGASSP